MPISSRNGSVVPVDHHIPDALRMTQVNQQGNHDHDVAEESRQHGRSEQRAEFLQLEDVDESQP